MVGKYKNGKQNILYLLKKYLPIEQNARVRWFFFFCEFFVLEFSGRHKVFLLIFGFW